MTSATTIIAVLCIALAAAYVVAERSGGGPLAWVAKIAASTCFIALALVNDALSSTYGTIVLTALVLSWLGDLLLLSLRSELLLLGIAAFLVTHVALAVAFASLPLDVAVFVAALGFWNIAALLLIRWLWKYLAGYNKVAVIVYLAAISVVASLAFATESPIIVLAATAFAISDISVARDRFVERSIANKAWGIPLYYFAQILFAMSVIPGAL